MVVVDKAARVSRGFIGEVAVILRYKLCSAMFPFSFRVLSGAFLRFWSPGYIGDKVFTLLTESALKLPLHISYKLILNCIFIEF